VQPEQESPIMSIKLKKTGLPYGTPAPLLKAFRSVLPRLGTRDVKKAEYWTVRFNWGWENTTFQITMPRHEITADMTRVLRGKIRYAGTKLVDHFPRKETEGLKVECMKTRIRRNDWQSTGKLQIRLMYRTGQFKAPTLAHN
jgi:hypothetical protein